MSHLELIMSDARRPLGPDDVEALLKRVERPVAPDDMLAKVRARLAAERVAAAAEEPSVDLVPSPPTDDVVAPALFAPVACGPVNALEAAKGRPWLRWGVEGLAVACAVLALVVAVQVGEQLPHAGGPSAEAAGIGGSDSAVVDARLVAKGLDAALVLRLARDAGLKVTEGPEGAVFEGGAHDVRRFLVSLRVEAARKGVDVQGFVPEAGKLRLSVLVK